MQTQISREQALADLHESVCRVTFTKLDGTERVMLATLKEDMLPPRQGDASPTPTLRDRNLIAVWDVEKGDWRSFYPDRVTNWSRE